jgi:formamidopyrimidine-DNA glycosylase
MPELPEVETIVRDLRRLVKDATIRRVEVQRSDLIVGDPSAFAAAVAGRTIGSVTRRAKNIVLDLGNERLVVNLGMTGRMLVLGPNEQEPAHLGVRFDLEDGRRIVYQDVRRFGRLELIPEARWRERSSALGIEPLSTDLTAERLFEMTRKSRAPIKPWLMDQRRIVGIGNIYASEILFRAGVSPLRRAGGLTRKQAARLVDATREVLREAIDFRGTTLLDYRDANGGRGEFSRHLRVYGRRGEPCVGCAGKVRRIMQAGRSTFYCPRCQK